MKKLKQFFSIVLACVLTFSCMNLPAFAADEPELVLSVKSYNQETGTVGSSISTANAGDVIVLSVGLKAGSAPVSIAGYQFKVNYDKNMVALWAENSNVDSAFYDSNTTYGKIFKAWGMPTIGEGTLGEISYVLTYTKSTSDYTTLNKTVSAGDTVELLQTAFQVKSDTESGNALFSFNNEYLTKVIYYADANSQNTTAIEPLGKTDTEALAVNGVAPTLESVTLDAVDNSVTVNGTTDATVQATATSTSKKDITSLVTWSISPTGEESNDVTIDENTGAITVPAKAAAGSYTVTATAKSGESQGDPKTTTLKVERAASEITSVVIKGGITGAVAISATDAQTFSDKAYKLQVKDQYGTYDWTGDVDWTVSPAGEGVTIDDESGVVTLAANIKDYVTNENLAGNPKTYTITGTVGGQSASATLSLYRKPEFTSVVIYRNSSAAGTSVLIPIPASGIKTENFNVKLFDQFGVQMSGSFSSSIDGSLPTGTTCESDQVKVEGNANPTDANTGTFTLKFTGTVGTVTKEASVEITVAKLVPNWESSGITVNPSPKYGDSNATIVTVPTGDNATLPYNLGTGTGTLTGKYTVVDAEAKQGVGEKTITVNFTASSDSSNGAFQGVTLSNQYPVNIAKKSVTVSGITAEDKEYDGNTDATLDFSGVTITGKVEGEDLGVTATGAFADKDAGANKTVNLSNLALTGTAAVLANYTLATSGNQPTATATISKKELTLNQGTIKVEKVYDGTVAAASAVSGKFGFTGVIGSEGGKGNLFVQINYEGLAFDSANAGTWSVQFTGLAIAGTQAGNYELNVSTFTVEDAKITAKDITAVDVTVDPIPAQDYTGAQITPAVTITYKTMKLQAGTDYTCTYGANVDCAAGENDGSVEISGKGNYSGTKTVYFDITPTTTTLSIKDGYGKTYDGTPIANPTAEQIESNLASPTVTYTFFAADGKTSISAPTSAGTYYVQGTIAAGINYTAVTSEKKQFTIAQKDISAVTIEPIAAQVFSGSALTPGLTVKDGSTTLGSSDYTAAYTNNINAGMATVTITGQGNYSGTKTANFTIKPMDVSGTMSVTVATGSTYNGSEQKPAVTVKGNDTLTLTEGTDYTLTYSNNINAGDTAKVTVSPATSGSNYTFTAKDQNFSIAKKTVTALAGDLVITKEYNGTNSAGSYKSGALTLDDVVSGDEVSVTYTTIGTYATTDYGTGINVELSGLGLAGAQAGNYELSATSGTFAVGEITKKQPAAADFTFTITASIPYDGAAHPVAVTTSKTGMGSFTVLYNGSTTEPKAAGTYAVTLNIAEGDNYAANSALALGSFTIERKSLGTGATYTTGISVEDIAALAYNGAAKTPAPVVKDGETVLIANTDYTVTYADNTNAGTATITITGKGNYTGTITKTFEITKKSLADADVTVDDLASYTYTGSDIEPLVNVKWGSVTLVKDTDYTVAYAANTNAGTATVTITGKGNYSGAKEKTFTINPAALTGTVTIELTDANSDGKVNVGEKLTASGVSGVTYQWYNNGTAITGATSSTYTVAEGNTKITVKVTASGSNYTGSLTSAAVEVGKSQLTGTVSVSNTDGTLTAAITGAPDAENYTIVWLRDGAVISGATGTTYTVTDADKGHTISAKIVAKGDTYTGEVAGSGVAIAATKPKVNAVNPTAGDGSATVQWSASANGAEILNYEVSITIGAEVTTITLGGSTTSHTFSGLENGKTYTVGVKAINSVGTSDEVTATVTPKASSGNGGNTGGIIGGGSGGGSSSGSNTSTSTTKNPDGSTTTTTTNKTTGTVTEVTKQTDGTTVTVETKKDGTVTETVKTPDGVTGTTVTDPSGNVTEAKATVTTTAVKTAEKNGEAVTLPVEVPAAKDTDDAPAVTVTIPRSADSVKVEIPVEKVTPGTVAVIVKADGTEEIVKTSVPTVDGVALTLAGSATVKVIDNSKPFTDVHGVNYWAKDSIDFVTSRELFTGKTATRFDPNASTTRAQLMTVLARLDGADTKVAPLQKGMNWAVEQGISDGSNPNGTISRQQLATMLWRYAGCPASDLTLTAPDASNVSSYAQAALSWAVENGIVNGKADGRLDPHGTATRGQVAAMVERFCKNIAKK